MVRYQLTIGKASSTPGGEAGRPPSKLQRLKAALLGFLVLAASIGILLAAFAIGAALAAVILTVLFVAISLWFLSKLWRSATRKGNPNLRE